jgi:hypothetical protein
VRYVLKNLVRDWAAEGALERQQSYGRILAELKARFAGWCVWRCVEGHSSSRRCARAAEQHPCRVVIMFARSRSPVWW